jgi:surfactin synthase thioesterase subunit
MTYAPLNGLRLYYEIPMTIETLADDVVALLDHLGIAEADFFGFSLGGLVAYAMRDAYEAVAPDPAHFEEFAAKTTVTVHEFPGWTQELRSLGNSCTPSQTAPPLSTS